MHGKKRKGARPDGTNRKPAESGKAGRQNHDFLFSRTATSSVKSYGRTGAKDRKGTSRSIEGNSMKHDRRGNKARAFSYIHFWIDGSVDF
jgi:hypothetical protein